MIINKEQSYKIQLLRGLAIIAVVFIHNTPTGMSQVYLRPFMNFSVGLFLFLSGLLTNFKKVSLLKRLKKVLIPYFIWTLIYVTCSNITNPISIPISYAKALIKADAAAMMYYIFVYSEFMILLSIIDKLAHSKWKYLGFLIAPLEIIFMRTIPLVLDVELNKYIMIVRSLSCLGWFSYFYLGYLIGNNLIEVKLKTKMLSFFLIIAVLLQMLEGYWYLSMGEVNCGTQIKISSVLTGVIFALICYLFICSKKKIKSKILHILGDYSFGIYFSHIAVMKVLVFIPYYVDVLFPIKVIIILFCTCCCIYFGKKNTWKVF